MKKFVTTFLALLIFTSPVLAKIKAQQIPDVLIEGTVLTLKDENLSSKKNPLKIQIVTTDGTVTELTPFLDKTGKQAQVLMPLIPDVVGNLAQIIIKISGGSILTSSPAEFARILSKKPTGFQGDPVDGNIASSQTSLPETSSIGLILEGPAGPAGPQGAAGTPGAQGANGAPGPSGPIPTAYPGANIVGAVAQAVAFTGNLAGDVTGPMSATAISNSVVTGKQLNGYSVAAGTVNNGDSLQTAISKLDGTLQANDADNLAIHGLVGTPSSSNTASEIVKRDASGNFSAGTITAVGFSGPLTGNVLGDLTGNVLGNVSGNLTGQVLTSTQSNITNLPALANVGTATTFAGTVTAPAFSGPLNGAVNGNLTGTVLTPTQNSIATMTGLTKAGTSGIKTTFLGPVNGAEGFIGNLTGNLTGQVLTASQTTISSLPALTNAGSAGVTTTFAGPVSAPQGFSGVLTGSLTGNVNGNASTSTNASNVTGSSQPAITSLGGLIQAGAFGSTINVSGSLNVAQNANVTGALSAGSFLSSGTIVAPKFVGNLQGNVLTAAQPNITSLAGLTAAGTGGVTTTFAGPVAATQGFSGNLTGNVTGNADTATNATNAANVTGASQPAITTLANLASVGAAGGTTFAGTVTAPLFVGNISGSNVTSAVANATNAVNATTATTANSLDGVTGTGLLTYNDTAANWSTSLVASANNAVITLPATTSTLATTTGLTPIAIAGATVDVDTLSTFSSTGVNYLVISDVADTNTTNESITTITGAVAGQRLTVLVAATTAAPITIVDNDTGAADTIDATADINLQGRDVVELIYDGTSWHVISVSANNT